MAEADAPNLESHIRHLNVLCRICGEKLSKQKARCENSHSVAEHSDLLSKNFGLNVEKDESEVHPTRFCNKCYISTSDSHKTRESVTWETHTEDCCKTCNSAKKIEKGGRPKKSKRGRPSANKSTVTGNVINKSAVSTAAILISRIAEKKGHQRQNPNYSLSLTIFFQLNEPDKVDYRCPICREFLYIPVETPCEHHFYADCMTTALEAGGGALRCAVCTTEVSEIKPTTRALKQMVLDLEVQCKTCQAKMRYEDCVEHARQTCKPPVPAPLPVVQPDPTMSEAMGDILQGKSSKAADKFGIALAKQKLRLSEDGKTVQLKTGGKVSRLPILFAAHHICKKYCIPSKYKGFLSISKCTKHI